MNGITVITSTIEGREAMLAEAAASVQAQTLQADQHLIYLDTQQRGPAACRNDLLSMTVTEFVAFLDDDDVLYPDHLATLMRYAEDEGPQRGPDLVFSWHDGGPGVPRFDEWNGAALAMTLGGRNIIPVTVLARTEAIRNAGCFRPEDRYEDHALFCRMLELGCRFVCVPQVTWEYRIAADGRTWNP